MVGISDSVYRYQPDAHRDDEVIMTLQEAVDRYPAYGFSKLFKILGRWGHGWNHKRVYRLYCALNLNKRRRGKKRLPSRHPEPLVVPAQANHCWSMDFMSDSLFWRLQNYLSSHAKNEFIYIPNQIQQSLFSSHFDWKSFMRSG